MIRNEVLACQVGKRDSFLHAGMSVRQCSCNKLIAYRVPTQTGQSHLICGTGSTSHVVTNPFSKLYFADALYRPLKNLDAIALGVLPGLQSLRTIFLLRQSS